MRKVGSRELKNRLGRYLDLVGKGQAILVTDRGKPVAKLIPAAAEADAAPGLEEKLRELEAAGHLRLGTRPFTRFKAVRTKGNLASRIILDGRR